MLREHKGRNLLLKLGVCGVGAAHYIKANFQEEVMPGINLKVTYG